MARKRIKPRFYVFLTLLAVIIFLIVRPFLPTGTREAVVMQAATTNKRAVQAVIIRDEAVTSSESTARVEFVAKEGTVVSAEEEVAYVYSAGYTEKELKKLEQIRSNIQTYHKTLLSNILDAQLERLDSIVDSKAIEFRNMVSDKSNGNLLGVIRQLETSMVSRQEYMRQNKREDTKLTKLYSEENSQLNSISTWRNVMKANESGILSFYMDGYENLVNSDTVDGITIEFVKMILNGETLERNSRKSDIYKIVQQTNWHVAVIDKSDWNPFVGQQYEFQLDGVPDISYSAVVKSVQKYGDEVCAVLSVNEPIGPLLYHRSGNATLSINLNGLSVPKEAVVNENGQSGVWAYDGMNRYFVAVNVLLTDRENAMVEPVDAEALTLGMRVVID